MDTPSKEGSARIYQFPPGGRASLATRRYQETSKGQLAPSIQPTIYSDSWYHDEAIQDAKPAWDR